MKPPAQSPGLRACWPSTGEELVHNRRTGLYNGSQLVPVDQFSDRRTAVPDEVGDFLYRQQD